MFSRVGFVDYVGGNQRTFDRSPRGLRRCRSLPRGKLHLNAPACDHRCSACAVASSAGKKHSRASSERVTSIGVPKTVVVLIKLSLPASVTSWNGTNTPAVSSRGGGIRGFNMFVAGNFVSLGDRELMQYV